MTEKLNFIIPNWPAPKNVHALQTNRYTASGDGTKNGFSLAPYDSLNLGSHVKDNPMHVAQNRQLLSQFLPSEPVWLNQVHGINVVSLDEITTAQTYCVADSGCADCVPSADASFTTRNNVVCVTMTADCLPIIICDTAGTTVASIHAGWRSLCDGVIEATILSMRAKLPAKPANLMAWLGPAIGSNAFEVGAEVRAQFMAKDAKAEFAFKKHGNKYLADIYQIATQRLNHLGVTQIYGGGRCTFTEKDQFFSFRRDGATGRMATLIWLS